MNKNTEKEYWSKRYENDLTGWNIGYPSTPIKSYFDQITDKNLKILIIGAGNAYEAEYLYGQGFRQVYVMDIAPQPLANFAQRVPDFPKTQLLETNFFEHQGTYDIIVEQTFFCSFPPLPKNREAYAKQVANLLSKGGKLVGVWFNFPLRGDLVRRPFGGSKEEYIGYFEPYFDISILELCYNSISPRKGNELFGLMVRK